MSLKYFLKTNNATKIFYRHLADIKKENIKKNRVKFTGVFHDRSKQSKTLCIVLAGYKEYLYDDVFGRLKAYQMKDMDICVVSSGKFSDVLNDLCEKNKWSYLSTKVNNVSLIQNIAINKHPAAKYIFKLDEDIFITEGFFDKMLSAYKHAQESDFVPGVMAPILPINGYGHVRVLEKLGIRETYEKKFGVTKIAAGPTRMVENSPEVARFFWGEGGIVPKIDELNEKFGKNPQVENACAIRFSIGAILFERQLWEDMGYLSVEGGGSHMGVDEGEVCSFCLLKSRPIMVSDNVVCGHFSFGGQTKSMIDYYKEHREMFSL